MDKKADFAWETMGKYILYLIILLILIGLVFVIKGGIGSTLDWIGKFLRFGR